MATKTVKGVVCNVVEKGSDIYYIATVGVKRGRVLKIQTKCKDPSKAQQHTKDKADINHIIRTARTSGRLDQANLNVQQPTYGDFSNVANFLDMQNKVGTYLESFNQLPAKVRKEFRNDPKELIKFVNQPKTAEHTAKGIELGLFTKPEPIPEPIPEAKPAE